MPKLLIVDDDPIDREMAARCVADIDDLEVSEAVDGRAGLDACLAEPPDLVLTDLRMPNLDGLSLVEALRQRLPQVPVILMTARGSERVAADALEAGAVSYVPKGEMAELLAEIVEQALAIATSRRERADVLRYFKSSESRFELASDVNLISPIVAYLQDELERLGFADDQARSQIGMALAEALSNAMIHGNLEVSSDLRQEDTGPYHRLIAERSRSEPWSLRRVAFRAEHSAERVSYLVRDEGGGFDRSSLPDPTSPESMLKPRGRGLFLMHTFMDAVEYNDAGNEVRLTKRAPAGGAPLSPIGGRA